MDVVITINITEYQALEIPICMFHEDTRKGAFPVNNKAVVQYGRNLQALGTALNTVSTASINRTHNILSGVFIFRLPREP